MQRYFFDTYDGDVETRDIEGLEVINREQMKREAIIALPEMARELLPDGDRLRMAVKVRDEKGRYVFEAVIDFSSAWLDT